jgi:adenylate kinase
MVRKLAVISAPGAFHALGGAQLVGETMALKVLSAGDCVREHVQQGTEWGLRIGGYLEAGHLVPDEVITELIMDTMSDVVGGWLLFGYPRSVRQARLFAQVGYMPDAVVEVSVTSEEFARDWPHSDQRMQLPDMIALYRSQVAAVQEFYRASRRFYAVSGVGGPHAVAARLNSVTCDVSKAEHR